MKKLTPRDWTVIFAGAAVLALLLLSASLNLLQLDPGKPIDFSQKGPAIYDTGISDNTMRALIAILRVMMIVLWAALPLYILLLIFDKETRKRFLRDVAGFIPIFILLYLFLKWRDNRSTPQEIPLQPFGAATPAIEVGTAVPLPDYTPPPAWVTTAVVIGIASVITLVVFGAVYVLWRRSNNKLEPLSIVEREAQAAIDAIQAGGDIRDIILRCYAQMIEALQQYRAIYRGQDMTPHEFGMLLEQRGLPAGPVQQLTQLFEQVRYGAQTPGRQEERAAIASLAAIVSACQNTRTP